MLSLRKRDLKVNGVRRTRKKSREAEEPIPSCERQHQGGLWWVKNEGEVRQGENAELK